MKAEFIWISDDYVIAIDVDRSGERTCCEAKVHPDGTFEIVGIYTLPPEQSRKTPA